MNKANNQQDKSVNQKWQYKRKMCWDLFTESEKQQISQFAQKYIQFLNTAKTEREAVSEVVRQAKEQGYIDISLANPGGKYYQINRDKNMALCLLGREDLRQGIRLIVSHLDAPRLDLKPNPLYEDVELALLRTHYYGGIKKYQWVGIPLAIHGTIISSDGRRIEIVIGEEPADPVFTIADLLPHLGKKMMETKKMIDAIEGEKLTILVGHQPIETNNPEEKERIKNNILRLLSEKYDLTEEDLISAEIEVVPAWKAQEVGLDRSMIGGYGQDDRICAFTSMEALFTVQDPKYTSIVLFVDKEEIGSEGNTGAQSRFLEIVLSNLLPKLGLKPEEHLMREILFSSKAISADVNAALDPNYQEVFEKQNASRFGYGVSICKYTGSGGKYSASDASAEYMGEIRKLFNDHGVAWQAKELGKVDEGGGGTVAKFLAIYGMDMIDCGPAILGMHSPFEVASKADLFESYKAFKVFLEK